MSAEEDTNVRVAVRCRPFNKKEKSNGESSCVRMHSDQIVLVNPATGEEHSFGFDIIVDENATQESVWKAVGVPILNKALSGFNGTIFAYGQTGSGKTWSMQGIDEEDLQGIIPRMNVSLFQKIETEKQKKPTIQFLVTVSYFEIYNEIIFDLLDATDRKKKNSAAAKGGLEIKEHPLLGVYVKGLQEIVVDDSEKLQAIIDQGMKSRTVASTQMNADSSRSHSVFMITVHQKDLEDESRNIFAKINLVDLAGSERVKSTGASGSTLKEGANINKSLSALGNVINALVEASKGKGTFIPYRNSKLTRVLQESLGGNSITAMLAAMSPAASNFEETLSTLKYANRAKDIKVKAVKNEEASQVSKLNDEIRMLKEKLAQGGGGGSGGGGGGLNSVDTTELEEKHKQQLRELEEAMRSTWEAKSKISAEYEKERQQLALEQQQAARMLESVRERNWSLLEEKGDLEVTISHMKELAASLPSGSDENGGGINGATPVPVMVGDLIPALTLWSGMLKEVMQMERALAEQDTTVQVYRTSLEKDSQAMIKNGGGSFDSSAASLLKQLRDKFSSTSEEVSRWMSMQDSLLNKVQELASSVRLFYKNNCTTAAGGGGGMMSASCSATSLAGGASGASAAADVVVDRREILRGLALLNSQATDKQVKSKEAVAVSRQGIMDFNVISTVLVKLLKQYDEMLTAGVLQSESGNAAEEESKEDRATRKQLVKTQQAIVLRLNDLDQSRKSTQDILSNATTSRSASPFTSGGVVAAAPEPLVESNVTDYRIDYQKSIHGKKPEGEPKVDVNGDNYWSCGSSDFRSGTNPENQKAVLSLTLSKPQHLTSLTIQGALIKANVVTKITTAPVTTASAGGVSSTSPVPSGLTLSTGLTLDACDGTVDTTASALGSVLDWTILLKKNPPDKFLKRPPVRFLFDLIKCIAELNPGFFSATLAQADWEVVGLSKQSKSDFMQALITFIGEDLGISESVTTATNIVTGSDPELTNTLLQQLAFCLHKFQQKSSSGTSAAAGGGGSASATAAPAGPTVTETKKVGRVSCWTTSARVCLSLDGVNWTHSKIYSTNLSDDQGTTLLPLTTSFPNDLYCRHVKVIPLSFGHKVASSGGGDVTPTAAGQKVEVIADCGPALRVSLRSINKPPPESAGNQADDVLQSITVVHSKAVLSVLSVLISTFETIIEAVEQLAMLDEVARKKKQDENKKYLDSLAREKAALQQLLESEKQSLTNDKQDLSDQLKKCFQQLRETESLLEKQQEINVQVDNDYKAIEEKYRQLQSEFGKQEQESAAVKAELLKLQANAIKSAQNIESKQNIIDEHEKTIETLRADIEYQMQLKASLEQEKEELLSNHHVLTGELEAARNNEESLFEKLNERTIDLERLQESYVDISDQYNNSQDEIMELRDQVQALQEALASKTMFAKMATSSSATPTSGVGSSGSGGGGIVKASAQEPPPPAKEPLSGGEVSPRGSKSVKKESKSSRQKDSHSFNDGAYSHKSEPKSSGVITSSTVPSTPQQGDAYAEDFDNYYEDEFED